MVASSKLKFCTMKFYISILNSSSSILIWNKQICLRHRNFYFQRQSKTKTCKWKKQAIKWKTMHWQRAMKTKQKGWNNSFFFFSAIQQLLRGKIILFLQSKRTCYIFLLMLKWCCLFTIFSFPWTFLLLLFRACF